MEVLADILNVNILRLTADYVSENCLKILYRKPEKYEERIEFKFTNYRQIDDNIPNMTIQNIESYIKYLAELMVSLSESKSAELEILDDFCHIVVNLRYYIGEYNILLTHHYIDATNPIFTDERFGKLSGIIIETTNLWDYEDRTLLSYCLMIKLSIHRNNVNTYINKYLKNDNTFGRMPVIICEALPLEIREKEYCDVIRNIAKNTVIKDGVTIREFISLTSELMLDYKFYDYIDSFIQMGLSENNTNYLIACVLIECAKTEAPRIDWNCVERIEKVKTNPDKYLKLARAYLEFCLS